MFNRSMAAMRMPWLEVVQPGAHDSTPAPMAQSPSQAEMQGEEPSIPVGWEAAKDPISGLTYYFRRTKGKQQGCSQWAHPGGPAPAKNPADILSVAYLSKAE